eukprot:3666592-Prymnesium_polylepis.1
MHGAMPLPPLALVKKAMSSVPPAIALPSHPPSLSRAAGAGNRWDDIAARLPGRTSDAVRNRWHRLQKDVTRKQSVLSAAGSRSPLAAASPPPSVSGAGGISGAADFSFVAITGIAPVQAPPPAVPAVLPPVAVAAVAGPHGGAAGMERGTETRAMWSAEEDAIIEAGVARFGCKWRQASSTPRPSATCTPAPPHPSASLARAAGVPRPRSSIASTASL